MSLFPVNFVSGLQTWHDLKKRIKQKAGDIKRARLKTGGKAPKDDKGRPIPPLTQEEEILFRLCGGDDWVGQDEEEEIGLRQPIVSTFILYGTHFPASCPTLFSNSVLNNQFCIKALKRRAKKLVKRT